MTKKKRCAQCGARKRLSSFNRNSARRDGLQTFCRECDQRHSRAYYAANPRAQVDRVVARNRLLRKENTRKVIEVLGRAKCVDCGESDPVVLDFDHVRGVKRNSISRLILTAISWKAIELEIKKCEVRCSNCHRRRTARVGRHLRWRLASS